MKDKKRFIIFIVLIIGINAIAAAIWWFVFSGILKERDDISQLRFEADKVEKRLNNARSLGSLLKDVEKDTEEISAIFLNSKNIVKFIEELEFLNQKAGTALAIRAMELPGQTQIENPRFLFQVKGSFRNLFHYLSLLEDLPYQISLDKVSLTKLEGDDWQIDFEITLLSYQNT